MDEHLAVPLVSVAISLATFIYTMIMAKRKAGADRVAALEKKLESVDARLIECEEDRQQLRKEVLDLKTTILTDHQR